MDVAVVPQVGSEHPDTINIDITQKFILDGHLQHRYSTNPKILVLLTELRPVVLKLTRTS